MTLTSDSAFSIVVFVPPVGCLWLRGYDWPVVFPRSYVPSLERIVVLRLLAQLSSVYHTVTLERLQVGAA